MKLFTLRKRVSGMALGIALATGAVAVTGAFGTASEAHAQRAKENKKDRKGKAKSNDGAFSEQFLAAYRALDEAAKAAGTNMAPLQPQFAALRGMATTPEEKLEAGKITYNNGITASDQSMQLTGMALMLESGKVEAENQPRYNYIAYQLANAAKDYAKAKAYLQAAIDLKYSSASTTPVSLKLLMAETNFSLQDYRAGLAVLEQAIAETKAAGGTVDERWYKRGVGLAVSNKIMPEVYTFAAAWVVDFPTDVNWRDLINLTRNLEKYQGEDLLDLLRVSNMVGTLKDRDSVIFYAELADGRRLPLEVKSVVEAEYARDPAAKDDIELQKHWQLANDRLADDRASLPELEADAMATTDEQVLVVNAGDTFHNYKDFVKAERLYTKAAGMGGAETNVALTRLGMTQIEMGKYAEAKATLAKVTGKRMPLAVLLTAYATQLEAEAGA